MEKKEINTSVKLAPFETFREHYERAVSDSPYNDEFIERCRQKALEYSKMDEFLRPSLLGELKKCIPRHFWNRVFADIGVR